VDLGRNDLGRVCRPGTVRPTSFQQVERYSHVMHLVSRVEGQLRDDATRWDLVRSVFPAGTLSGAPKIRAMEIIGELEGRRRGPYGGAVGYLAPDGDLDLCIAIRTLVLQGERWWAQAGAGIVADSDPTAEYHETLHKLRAITRAITVAEGGLQ
jgi:anthranilate synthase component 1